MPRDCPEFFGPDFATRSGRRVLNHTGAKLLNNFSYPNLLSIRFLMHCKHSRPKNWGRKTRGNLGAFPFHPDRGSTYFLAHCSHQEPYFLDILVSYESYDMCLMLQKWKQILFKWYGVLWRTISPENHWKIGKIQLWSCRSHYADMNAAMITKGKRWDFYRRIFLL